MEDKKENTTEDTKEDTKEDSGDGDKPKAVGLIDGANTAAERVEKAVSDLKKENDRTENIAAEMKLGGQAESGSVPTEKKEETPKEYNDRIDKEMSEGKHAD